MNLQLIFSLIHHTQSGTMPNLRRRLAFVACLLPLACSIAAGQAPPPVQAHRIQTAPVVDGKLDDGCWQGVPAVTGFLTIDSDEPAAQQSFGYLCFDDDRLYVGVKCLLPAGVTPKGEVRPHDANVFRDEIIEVMIAPGTAGTSYYQLVISAYGATFDAMRSGGGAAEDDAWNGEWTGAAWYTDGYWSAELAIPFYGLALPPDVGSEWRINLCREAKTPGVLSAIGLHGAFNDVSRFRRLTGVTADFARLRWGAGPAVAVVDTAAEPPTAVLVVPVVNNTGQPQTVRIEHTSAAADGGEQSGERTVTIAAGAKFELVAEPLRIERLFADRQDLFVVRSSRKQRTIRIVDAATEETLAQAALTTPVLCEPLRLDIVDPWQLGLGDEPPTAVMARIRTRLKAAPGMKLRLRLVHRDSGAVLREKTTALPLSSDAVAFDVQGAAAGAYRVEAVVETGDGRQPVQASRPAMVLPHGPRSVRVLNNLVSELANTRERGMQADTEVSFMNPRRGWVFISVAGNVLVSLDAEAAPLQLWPHPSGAGEAMRLLPAGMHTLSLSAPAEQVIVRSVPALVHYSFPSTPYMAFQGPYDWAFLESDVLPNLNTIASHNIKTPEALRRWTALGRKWICNATVPGTHGVGGLASKDKCLAHWLDNAGYQHELTSGVIADEFTASDDDQYLEWAKALIQLTADPDHGSRTFYPWFGSMAVSETSRLFTRVVTDSGSPCVYYYYLSEKPDRQQADELVAGALVRAARACNDNPDVTVRRAIFTLGYMSAPPESQNCDPRIDFKVHMDLQMRTLATAPELFGLWGLIQYSATYCDEENARWAGRLYRHYAIDGATTPLTQDPYVLPHLRNPDFEAATSGWDLAPAEQGGIRVEQLPGYGAFQGRYLSALGDRFLVTRRSARGPNSFSQEIKALTPGRVYSLKMITADLDDIRNDRSNEKKQAVQVRLDGVDLLPGDDYNLQFTYANHPGHRLGKFGDAHHAYMNYHWYVFRARSESARLTVSDWAALEEPGGEIGREIMYNFIELQPYAE